METIIAIESLSNDNLRVVIPFLAPISVTLQNLMQKMKAVNDDMNENTVKISPFVASDSNMTSTTAKLQRVYIIKSFKNFKKLY